MAPYDWNFRQRLLRYYYYYYYYYYYWNKYIWSIPSKALWRSGVSTALSLRNAVPAIGAFSHATATMGRWKAALCSPCDLDAAKSTSLANMTSTCQRHVKDYYATIRQFQKITVGSLEVKLPTIWTDGKAEVGRIREEEKREEKKTEDQRRERVRGKKMQVREKECFFQWFVVPEGRKVGSLKRRVRSHLRRLVMKSCTLLWHEARFQVKMYKAHQLRSIFGSWDVEKVPANVARSTFPSQKCKKLASTENFVRFRCCFAWQLHVGHLKRMCKDACRVAHTVQETCSPEMSWDQGGGFQSKVAFWSIRSSGLPRWFWATGAALHLWPGITFSWQAQYFAQVVRKTQGHEAVSSALNFPFFKEVSQDCFVFDVVSLKILGRLAEELRFWRCQVQKLRKSRRLAALLTLSPPKREEVSQNSFAFKLADR